MDQTTVELRAPLPNGDAESVLEWRAPRAGLRPGDEPVSRISATHAVLRTVDLDGRRDERRLELAEAHAYLSEARALHERAAAGVDKGRERVAQAQRVAAEIAASIDVSCPRCNVPRTHRGLRQVVTAARPEEVLRAESGLARYGVTAYHEYACPRCGSVELFTPGPLPHPLPGTAAAG